MKSNIDTLPAFTVMIPLYLLSAMNIATSDDAKTMKAIKGLLKNFPIEKISCNAAKLPSNGQIP